MESSSKLKTGWICVATSGHSVDGRQITSEELHQMADSYDPQYYTANLWREHFRWANLGQVLELKAEDQANGETKLYAVIAPNSTLIEMNKEGQGLFSSVEIAPNFRNSGSNYLFGLGITDSPASVGTTQLQFFKQQNPKDNTECGQFVKLDFALEDAADDVERGIFQFFKKMFSTQQPQNSNNNNNKETTMDKEQFNALMGAINVIGARIDAVEKQFSTNQSAQPEPQTPPTTETTAEPDSAENTVTAAQFNQLLQTVTALDNKLTALTQEVTPTPNGVPNTTDTYSFKQGF